jgi:uncharacterized membrane protein
VGIYLSPYAAEGFGSNETFEGRIQMKLPQWTWGTGSVLDRVLSIVLVLAVVGCIGTLSYMLTSQKASEAFTEFYILGSDGKADNYPRELVLGNITEVTLCVVNHENQRADYYVEVIFGGQLTQQIRNISLGDEQKWQTNVTVVPGKAGDNQKVEFLLYKDEGIEPYLTLHLWLDVKEKQ